MDGDRGRFFIFIFIFLCFLFVFYFFYFWSFRALDCIKVLHPAFILLSSFFFFIGCIC